jgi:hypothetical protein
MTRKDIEKAIYELEKKIDEAYKQGDRESMLLYKGMRLAYLQIRDLL